MSSDTLPIEPEIRSSIRRKIVAVVLIGVATTILLTTLANSWREASRYTRIKTGETTAIANVFASAASEGVAARDRFTVLKTLRAIGKIPSFTHARVEDIHGATIAELGSAITLEESDSLPVFLRGNMSVSVDVINGGERVGRLTVLVNTSDLRENLVAGLLTGLAAAFLAGLVGVFIAFRLQRRITEPLRRLTQTMFEVVQTQRFGTGVDYESDDETGVLVRTFNNMIGQIRLRDERLDKHREQLEDTVEERTHDLKVAKEAAEDANAAKSEFLATMSHEIRTPMNGMLVMAELLSSANLSDKHRRYADVVVKSGQSLLTIINDILDFSKIESGKMDLEKIELDPSVVVDDVLNLFWDKANGKGLDLAGYVAPDVPGLVEGDPVRLNQIVSNLVNNALKFTEDGHVLVQVSTEEIGGTPHLRFSVFDTGIGIPEEKLSTVFESFSQADQTTTRKFGGTGLGLAICKRLVSAMGGTISVNSTVGEGSEFYFTLPTQALDETRSHAGAAPEQRSMNSLVCLPEPATGKVLTDYLQDCGLTVTRTEADDPDMGACGPGDVIVAGSRTLEKLAAKFSDQSAMPYFVSVSQIGETRTDELVAKGFVHDVVMRPVSRNDLLSLVDRLKRGQPRGRKILEARQSKALPKYPDLRLLVADDSPVNREVIVEALKQMEVTADLVENGREAVEAASATSYDLIFMDCSMPEMDGFEATRRIRETESGTGKRVPIVALTAQVAGASDDEWRKSGMDDYLTKPFRITDLAKVFDELVEGHPAETGEALAREEEAASVETASVSEDAKSSAIDDQVLKEALGCDPDEMPDLVLRMLGLFAEHGPGALLKLAEAAETGDEVAIGKTAHALKSMSGNIGARHLAAICQEVESDAQSGNLNRLNVQLAELQKAYISVIDEITDRRNTYASTMDGSSMTGSALQG